MDDHQEMYDKANPTRQQMSEVRIVRETRGVCPESRSIYDRVYDEAMAWYFMYSEEHLQKALDDLRKEAKEGKALVTVAMRARAEAIKSLLKQ